MTECPKCKCSKITTGRLAVIGRSTPIVAAFVPDALKWYQFSSEGGAELQSQAFACPDCGMVWTMAAYPEVLREVVSRFGSAQ